jgi:hypothetical protein
MDKKTQLHELIAVFADTSNVAKSVLDEARVTFGKKPEHFRGHSRFVQYLDESRQGEDTTDTKNVVTTVHDKLAYVGQRLGRHWDALYQLEEANQRAVADVVVDGNILVAGAPATWLLGMESRLKMLRDVLLSIPTLDPQIVWEAHEAVGKGHYRSPPTATFRTEKVFKSKVLYEATEHHPAQLQTWTEDQPVARVDTIQFSTMISPAEKANILERCDNLLRAVKKARQRANAVEVHKNHPAKTLFDYIVKG